MSTKSIKIFDNILSIKKKTILRSIVEIYMNKCDEEVLSLLTYSTSSKHLWGANNCIQYVLRKDIMHTLKKFYPDIFKSIKKVDYDDNNFMENIMANVTNIPESKRMHKIINKYNNILYKISKQFTHLCLNIIIENNLLELTKMYNKEIINRVIIYTNKNLLSIDTKPIIDDNMSDIDIVNHLSDIWTTIGLIDTPTLLDRFYEYVSNNKDETFTQNTIFQVFYTYTTDYCCISDSSYLLVPNLENGVKWYDEYIRIDNKDTLIINNSSIIYNEDKIKDFFVEMAYYGNTNEQQLYNNLTYLTTFYDKDRLCIPFTDKIKIHVGDDVI